MNKIINNQLEYFGVNVFSLSAKNNFYLPFSNLLTAFHQFAELARINNFDNIDMELKA